jgi:hypothetical protein
VEYSVADPEDAESLSAPSFVAIPELSRSDANTVLVFLSMNGSYLSEVNDLWFQAIDLRTEITPDWNGTLEHTDYYVADARVNVLACAEQYQLRNPITGAKSRLGGEEVATQSEGQRLAFNENQMAIFMRSFFIST